MLIRWLLDRWEGSLTFLTKLLAWPPHVLMRKASSGKSISFWRFHPEHTASTVAMLALMVRWSVHGKPEHWRESVEITFLSWTHAALEQVSCLAELSLDKAARCQPGVFAEGRDRLDIDIEGGSVLMEDLYAAAEESPLAQQVFRSISAVLTGRPRHVHLGVLLLALWRAGRDWEWCFRQVLVITALAIDSILPSLDLPSDPVTADVVAAPRKRKDPLLQQSVLQREGGASAMVVERVGATHGLRGRWVQRTQQIRLVKYYFAMRAWFPLCRVFCICMDGVRAGNIERVCGALLGTQRLSGQTRIAWLPPQDLMFVN